jgi:transglutaminase-like putative cysteine protease
MTRYLSLSFLVFILSFATSELFSQYKLQFGDISLEELSNKPYKPDPGADAVIISDKGTASLNYINDWYIEMERDVRIRIVNSNGFDYADIEIPFSADDRITNYRASTFNTRNGERTETKIPKKSFIFENTSKSFNTLKFNFPDVHEGSVIEYSYIIRLTGSSISTLVPWSFQSAIPVMFSSLTLSYPQAFAYKSIISGTASSVSVNNKITESMFFGERAKVVTSNWFVQDMPAFREEPYIKSKKEHLTGLSFELASVNFPGTYFKEITPTYESLTTKLLDRDDFGKALNTKFKSVAEKITLGLTDDLLKLKKIHQYISSNILWNGENDFTASASLRTILKKEKGNSADINMLLIAMLRSLNLKADPVILSTRSNGSLNEYLAMIQQFNYLIAYVSIDGNFYLVDATDPLRPFNVLPFDCLNGNGRLISEYGSKFIELKNNEKEKRYFNYNLTLDTKGDISGKMEYRYADYSAFNIRKRIKLESEEGYLDNIKSSSGNIELSEFKIENANDPYSDLVEKCNVTISNGVQITSNEIIFNPSLSLTAPKNTFISSERKFPVDFGCPVMETYSLIIKVPEGYSLTDKPADVTFSIGNDDAKYEFKCKQTANNIEVNSVVSINKTIFQQAEYTLVRDFYSKILQKQTELIILKRTL